MITLSASPHSDLHAVSTPMNSLPVAIKGNYTALPLVIHCYRSHEANVFWKLQAVIAATVGVKTNLSHQEVAKLLAAVRSATFSHTILGDLRGGYKLFYVVVRGTWSGVFLDWCVVVQ